MKRLVQKSVNINTATNNGNTGLHLAIQEGNKAVAMYLLSVPNCNKKIRNDGGKTVLDILKRITSNFYRVKQLRKCQFHVPLAI